MRHLNLRWLTVVAIISALCACAHRPASFTSWTIESGSAQLVVREIGSGPVIMMVPSAGRSSADFNDLARRVAETGWRVVLPEPRGVGGSTGLVEGSTGDDYARDLVNVATRVSSSPIVILAHAGGARDARLAIRLAPEHFSRLISLATGAGGGQFGSAAIGAEAIDRAMEGSLAQGEKPDSERLKDLQLVFFAPGNDPSVWLTGWNPAAYRVRSKAVRGMPRDKWWPGRPIPSLIVEAADDVIAPPQGQKLKSLLGPDAKIVLLRHAGHAILPEQPDAIADVVIAYLHGNDDLQAVIDRRVR